MGSHPCCRPHVDTAQYRLFHSTHIRSPVQRRPRPHAVLNAQHARTHGVTALARTACAALGAGPPTARHHAPPHALHRRRTPAPRARPSEDGARLVVVGRGVGPRCTRDDLGPLALVAQRLLEAVGVVGAHADELGELRQPVRRQAQHLGPCARARHRQTRRVSGEHDARRRLAGAAHSDRSRCRRPARPWPSAACRAPRARPPCHRAELIAFAAPWQRLASPPRSGSRAGCRVRRPSRCCRRRRRCRSGCPSHRPAAAPRFLRFSRADHHRELDDDAHDGEQAKILMGLKAAAMFICSDVAFKALNVPGGIAGLPIRAAPAAALWLRLSAVVDLSLVSRLFGPRAPCATSSTT